MTNRQADACEPRFTPIIQSTTEIYYGDRRLGPDWPAAFRYHAQTNNGFNTASVDDCGDTLRFVRKILKLEATEPIPAKLAEAIKSTAFGHRATIDLGYDAPEILRMQCAGQIMPQPLRDLDELRLVVECLAINWAKEGIESRMLQVSSRLNTMPAPAAA